MIPDTILVVDDRAINREYLVMLFESCGYRTLEAHDGSEALKIVKRDKVALVISDVLMPVMDGIQFANSLHADPVIAHIPIIFYTATYRESEARMLAQRCGVATVLAKPAEPQRILDSVSAILGKSAVIPGSGMEWEYSSQKQPEIVGLQHRLKAAFSTSQQSTDSDVATQSSPENLYALGNMQSLTLRTAALLELSMALSLEHEPQRLIELFCRAVQDIMNAKFAAVGMFGDGETRRFAHSGMGSQEISEIFDLLGTSNNSSEDLLSEGLLLNAANLPVNSIIKKLPAHHPLRRNFILAPVILRSCSYGWLYVAEKLGSDNFNEEDEQFLATLAVQLAPTYENMVLYDEARQRAGELELEIIERQRMTEELKKSETQFRQLAENINEVFFLISADNSQTLYVSPAYENIWGCTIESVYAEPQSWANYIHPEDKERAMRDYAVRDDMGRFDFSYRLLRQDGTIRFIRSRGFPIRDETGDTVRFAGIAEDITEQVLQARRIERVSRHYAVLSGINSAITRIHKRSDLFQETCRIVVSTGKFNVAWIGVIDEVTQEGEIIAWFGGEEDFINSFKLTARTGTADSDQPSCMAVREKRAVICNNVETDPSLISFKAAFLACGHHSVAAWPLMIDERVVAVLAVFAHEIDFFDDEQIVLLNELVDDLSFGLEFIKQAETESRLAKRLTTTFESITDAFIMLDREWNFTYLNTDAERLLSCPRDEVLGTNIWERFPEAVGGKFYQEYHKAVEKNCSVSFEEYYEPLELWVEIRAYPSEEGLAIYFADIGARKAAEEKINELAFFDKLTSLPNRQLLLNRLERAMALCKRVKQPGAVLFIDLDNFKSINDTRGHDKGDILLAQVAHRLKETVRASDTVARIGGDEYVILLENLGLTNEEVAINAKTVAESVIECFREPFDIAGQSQHSTCSIGIAIFDQYTVTFDDVLKCADVAMYQAKAAGRNSMTFFSTDMQARISKRVALESDLRTALTEQEFLLHYQPQIDINGGVTGVEALVRWNSPVRGLVVPAEFIPIAEDTGLILPLGQWVMKVACELLAKWGSNKKTDMLTMAVNVSASQFHHPDFVKHVLSVVNETGVNPKHLKLELTESLLVDDIESTIQKMNALKQIGILFSLDDFGTGYSSLSYLHRLPLDQLKIDQSFIRDALNDENAAVIVRTILALGKALNLSVIAEGVETAAHHAFIKAEGCIEYQGYLFCKPLTEVKLEEYISTH